MHILLSLLLFVTPVLATPTNSPVEELTGEQLCALIDLELWSAVESKIISQSDANKISERCWQLHTVQV